MDCSPPSSSLHGQEYWIGLSFPSPGDLPNPGIKPMSPALAGGSFTPTVTWEASTISYSMMKNTGWVPVSYLYKCLLSTDYVTGIVLGTEDRMLRKSAFVEITVKWKMQKGIWLNRRTRKEMTSRGWTWGSGARPEMSELDRMREDGQGRQELTLQNLIGNEYCLDLILRAVESSWWGLGRRGTWSALLFGRTSLVLHTFICMILQICMYEHTYECVE